MDVNLNEDQKVIKLITALVRSESLEMSKGLADEITTELTDEDDGGGRLVFRLASNHPGPISPCSIGADSLVRQRLSIARVWLERDCLLAFRHRKLLHSLIGPPSCIEEEMLLGKSVRAITASSFTTMFAQRSGPKEKKYLVAQTTEAIRFYSAIRAGPIGCFVPAPLLPVMESNNLHKYVSDKSDSVVDLVSTLLGSGPCLPFAVLVEMMDKLERALSPRLKAWLWSVVAVYCSFRLDPIQTTFAHHCAAVLMRNEEPFARYARLVSVLRVGSVLFAGELIQEAVEDSDTNIRFLALSAALRLQYATPKEVRDEDLTKNAFKALKDFSKEVNFRGTRFPALTIQHVVETLTMFNEPHRNIPLAESLRLCLWEPGDGSLERLLERKNYLLATRGTSLEKEAVEELKECVSDEPSLRPICDLFLWRLAEPACSEEIEKGLLRGQDALFIGDHVRLLLKTESLLD